MVYLRARYYRPLEGRFVSRDPSRLEANLHLYVGGNPINQSDPSGLIGGLPIDGPVAFAMCLNIHTMFGAIPGDLTSFSYLTAQDAVDICKAAYSKKAWAFYKPSFGLGKDLPTTAHELMGWFVYENKKNDLLFNGDSALTKELAVSTLGQYVRSQYYKNGDTKKPLFYNFGFLSYPMTLFGDSRNSAGNLSLPISAFLGSFYYQAITLPGENRVGFRIDNDTTLESGTHIRMRNKPRYQGSIEDLIAENQDLAQTPIQLLIWKYDVISILSSKDRLSTQGSEGGGNLYETFVWSEQRDECLSPLVYIHGFPEFIDAEPWNDYKKYTEDPPLPGR